MCFPKGIKKLQMAVKKNKNKMGVEKVKKKHFLLTCSFFLERSLKIYTVTK